jgi:signal transduction histidine kinase
MALTSVLILLAFTSIYLLNRSGLLEKNMEKLNAVAFDAYTVSSPAAGEVLDMPGEAAIGQVQVIRERLSTEYALSFSVDVDANGNIIKVHSLIDMPQEAYSEAVKAAWGLGDASTIKIGDKIWQYQIAYPDLSLSIFDGESGELISSETDTYRISFLDITESMGYLRRLLITFALAAVIMLAATLGISLFFANRAINPLAEAWEKQKQFIADASHELKTPLSAIYANYDMVLMNQEETVASQAKWFTYMKAGMDRMSGLIRDLLDLARVESEARPPRRAAFDISEKLRGIMRAMEAAANEKGISVLEAMEPGILLHSDAELVQRVFAVLYENAIQYTDANGQIEVTVKRVKKRVACTVKNTGKGIAPQDLPKVFDRFYRADAARSGQGGGYGLGLAIARQTIETLGGKLTAQSAEGTTSFTFTLEE